MFNNEKYLTTGNAKSILPITKKFKLPTANSHKGQNGKLLIVGGSDLFHAASRWSLDVASHFVDMVFYSSVPENNLLIAQAKEKFTNGIVVPRSEVESYIIEADCILIGPGMTREINTNEQEKYSDLLKNNSTQQDTNNLLDFYKNQQLSNIDWQKNTYKITTFLLAKYAHKKWVIDAGALQVVPPQLIPANAIITPHQQEMEKLALQFNLSLTETIQQLVEQQVAVLWKGEIDTVFLPNETYQVGGGNAGLTKGGTGDVLAGLAAALYCTQDITVSTVLASFVNKMAADNLYQQVGYYFNTSDLANQIPHTLWQLLQSA